MLQENPRFSPRNPKFLPENPRNPRFLPRNPRNPRFLPKNPEFVPRNSRNPRFLPRNPRFSPRNPRFLPRNPRFLPRNPRISEILTKKSKNIQDSYQELQKFLHWVVSHLQKFCQICIFLPRMLQEKHKSYKFLTKLHFLPQKIFDCCEKKRSDLNILDTGTS